jgi:SSS family solute:Na+ symporter
VSVTLAISLAGIVVIAILGFVGRRAPTADLSEWTVGGRKFGAGAIWFLQAGEVFTTFTFLGMAGLSFGHGVAAFYALPYVPIAFMGLYFLGPRLWRVAKRRDYLTHADFIEDVYASRPLGTVSAIFGIVFLLPYLQLQVTGLGLIVQLATGDAANGTLSMVIGFVLVVAFVLWSGIRGVVTSSYFKDVIMIVMLVVLVVAVPNAIAGGIGNTFHQVLAQHPKMLTLNGSHDIVWFITNMAISIIGVLFVTLPHTWPSILSARSEKSLRRNYIFLPLYELALIVPMIVGFAAILVLSQGTNSNATLLTLAARVLPDWLLGLVAVAGIATAMVPAAGLLIGMSSLLARNVARTSRDRNRYWINQATVVGATALALILAIFRPGLLANLLLLTYSGLDQLAPAIAAGLLWKSGRLHTSTVLVGLLAGEATVIYLTFIDTTAVGNVNVGIVGLGVNIVVIGILEAVAWLRGSPRPRNLPLATETEPLLPERTPV